MRMTRKVEVQAISWPSSWLPERQITPAFTCSAKPGSRLSGDRGVVGRSRPVCCGMRIHLPRALSAKGLSAR